MYSKKKKYNLRKKVVKAIWVIQRVAKMFLAKLELRRLKQEKALQEYEEAQMRKMEQEMLIQQQLEKQKRKEEAEKRKQMYFQQKNHIAQLSQTVKAKVQAVNNNSNNNKKEGNKMSTEGFNYEKKKKAEVIKNTEGLLKSIYNDLPRPVMKPGTSVAKKRDGMGSRTLTGGVKKRSDNSYPQLDFGNSGGNDNGMNALFKLFSKSPNFN